MKSICSYEAHVRERVMGSSRVSRLDVEWNGSINFIAVVVRYDSLLSLLLHSFFRVLPQLFLQIHIQGLRVETQFFGHRDEESSANVLVGHLGTGGKVELGQRTLCWSHSRELGKPRHDGRHHVCLVVVEVIGHARVDNAWVQRIDVDLFVGQTPC